MSNWTPCGCTRQQTVTGNGCLQCNPESAYEIAKKLWKEKQEAEKEKES